MRVVDSIAIVPVVLVLVGQVKQFACKNSGLLVSALIRGALCPHGQRQKPWIPGAGKAARRSEAEAKQSEHDPQNCDLPATHPHRILSG
jgi:hypothetical protein